MLTTDHFGGPLARSNHSMRFHCFKTRKHSLFLITFVLSRYIPLDQCSLNPKDLKQGLISSHLHSNWKDMYVLPIAPITEAHANLFAFLRARSKLCIISSAINPARVNLQIIARISPFYTAVASLSIAILSSSYRPESAFLINQPFLIFRHCNCSYIRPPCPLPQLFLLLPSSAIEENFCDLTLHGDCCAGKPLQASCPFLTFCTCVISESSERAFPSQTPVSYLCSSLSVD